jgi:hypothetical protein
MLYDDDQSGPPHEAIDPEDDRQRTTPRVNPEYLRQFIGADRILIVLEVARRTRSIRGSFRAEQVFENAGLPWNEPTIEMVFNALRPTGRLRVRRWPNGLYFSITDRGAAYIHALTGGTLPVPQPDSAGQAPRRPFGPPPIQPPHVPTPRPEPGDGRGIGGF